MSLAEALTTTAADDQAIVVEEPRVAWRAKGKATIPQALVAFFLLIAACFGVLEWGVNSWSLSRISPEDRVEVTAGQRTFWHCRSLCCNAPRS